MHLVLTKYNATGITGYTHTLVKATTIIAILNLVHIFYVTSYSTELIFASMHISAGFQSESLDHLQLVHSPCNGLPLEETLPCLHQTSYRVLLGE